MLPADSVVYGFWIVGSDLRTDTVLQGSHNLSARRVILRIRTKDDRNIKLKPHGVALNLNIALLHDVEERDLDLASEIGNLIDGEDSTIRPWKQTIVHG